MKISRENYELFFIDYLDGILTDQMICELEEFLLLNPDLREELEGMEKAMLSPEDFSFPDKDILRKIDVDFPVSEKNFVDHCVAYLEGDLDHPGSIAFQTFIKTHPEYQKELALYREAYLSPDSSVIYEDKIKLKKAIPFAGRFYFLSALSAAAAIALLVIVFWNYQPPEIMISQIDEKSSPLKTVSTPVEVPVFEQEIELESRVITAPEEKTIRKNDTISTQNDLGEIQNNSFEILATVEIKDLGSIVAQINLPSVHLGGAKPDVIKSELIQKEENGINNSLQEDDYLNLPDIALNYVNTKVLKREEAISDSTGITLWDVAHASVKGINRITGSNMKLEKISREENNSTIITFDAGFFSFTRPVK